MVKKHNSENCSIYRLSEDNSTGSTPTVTSYVASTPETRKIVNDPTIVGLEYTNSLRAACARILKEIKPLLPPLIAQSFIEKNTSVLNILRGGLNFGLREALHDAFGWNQHSAAFISAQRARKDSSPNEWHITENNYQKVYLPQNSCIIFGDVVATGTSLEFALSEMLNIAKANNTAISSFIFLTIGGNRSEEILQNISSMASAIFPDFIGSVVVYLEGRFTVADEDSKLSIKITGTDLLRSGALLSPELLFSQSEQPSYPLERCTIYDAGSRAFWTKEYFEDVLDYWKETKELSQNNLTYEMLLKERFPEFFDFLNQKGKSISHINLEEVAQEQIEKLEHLISK